MSLKIGMHTGQQDCTYEDLRRLWQMADSSGFHWISIWDHHYESPPLDGQHPAFETISIMSALALETKQVRVGCLVFCPAYRNPALVAKAITTIDHISGGRVDVGLGAGWHQPEYHAFGYDFPPPKVREDILEEAIQIVRSMLGQEKTNFVGNYFRVDDAYCFPRPIQSSLPIWVGGGGEKRTLRTAARYADGWNVAYVSPEAFRHKIEVLDMWCEKEGRDPSTLVRSINVGYYMGTDEADARQKRAALERDFGAQAEQRIGGMLVGAPAQAVDRIGQYADAGAQQLNIALRAPFDWESIQAFIEEVLPAFR